MSYILIVEDDEDNREIMVSLLEEWGYTVASVTNASQAVAHMQHGPVDLVLVDILLPDSDGLSLVRDIHTDHPSLPVLFVTALAPAQFTDVLELQRELGDDIIHGPLRKPFEIQELREYVRHITDTHPPAAPHPHPPLHP